MNITELLAFAYKNGASDLHLSAGLPPLIRVDGDLRRVKMEPLDKKKVMALISDIMTDRQRAEFEKNMDVDFSFEVKKLARFRVNVFQQDRGPAAVFRTIPSTILSLEDLKLPPIFGDLCKVNKGLILVTGPTGSGKSTTLAAMVNRVNQTRYDHILTIEDPIEFVHQSNKSLVNQREIHRDSLSFANALRAALREDPDVVLVGELRDLETIRLALSAAETGHIVFGTLHTVSAAKTVDRIVDVFPGDEQPMIRSMLSESLQAVISQTLIKKQGGGRVAAQEIMVCDSAIRNLIRENKIPQIYSSLQTGSDKGMQTLDMHLEQLVAEGAITMQQAYEYAKNKADFDDGTMGVQDGD
tara:strand:+ start:6526 stop:7593 length:1068 start_codon:yes stop_codon:yes gene_type:complete